jgi:hypothetical protein
VQRDALGGRSRRGDELEHAVDTVLALDGEQLLVEAKAGTEVHEGMALPSRHVAGTRAQAIEKTRFLRRIRRRLPLPAGTPRCSSPR